MDKSSSLIKNSYNSLLRTLPNETSKEDKKLIKKAFDLANSSHKKIMRKSGEPYIIHPISVAKIVSKDIGLGPTAIASALLHDVVEDTDVTLDDIKNSFGEKISIIIDGLTKISEIVDTNKSKQAENFRKMLLTLSNDINVILIKIADRLDNMRSLEYLSERKRKKIASETLYIYAPLAHRLGLYSIKSELEDLGLKHTESADYFSISKKLNETKKTRELYIKKFIKPLKKNIQKTGVDISSIKGRPKSIFSIRKKMVNQGIEFEEVFDKFAIRIITNSEKSFEKSDCWRVYSIVTDLYKPNPDRLRDWISTPKVNGYESLHTTVMGPDGHWVEIQIRSKRMDEIAEKGLAAHWIYKKDSKSKDENINNWINGIRELLEEPDSNAIEFLDEFKLNLFSKEIVVFSPKGDLVTLPKGSTSLDFAFNIHTELGKRCLGTKVNGKLVPLSHKLKSGDQIEIIISDKQSPKESWLDFVVTAKAKNKIKSSLNEEKKKIAKEGKEILKRKLKHLRTTFSEKIVNELQSYFKLQDSQELFYRVAIGKINNSEIKKYVKNKESWYTFFKQKLVRKKKENPKKEEKKEKHVLKFGDDKETFDYKTGSCCNPIPGDQVFGFITVKDGIKVHSYDCPNAIRLKTNFDYRTIEGYWVNVKDMEFKAHIEISGIDSTGIVNKITKIISNDMHVGMDSISFKNENGFFKGKISILVKNKIHINKLMQRIKKLEEVKKIERKLK
ncbi:MAG: RelA/SpoT family protein [Flavobacteriales bacterium]|nr:RelA/SpoT family protein [Flavobacteriales bacterium]